MNEQQAREVADSLRRAAAAGAKIEELTGAAARDFVFVSDVVKRPLLLGSFRIAEGVGEPLYVSVLSSSGSMSKFQVFVMERPKSSPILGTNKYDGNALVWRYRAAKQSGDNEKRNQEFMRLAGTDVLRFPIPRDDPREFVDSLRKALDLRHRADAAGGVGGSEAEDIADEELVLDELRRWYPESKILEAVAVAMLASIRRAHALNPRSWCVTHPRGRDLYRLNVGAARVLDIGPDYLLLQISTDALSPESRSSLVGRLDTKDSLKLPEFGGNGALRLSALELSRPPADVLAAHETIVTCAARRSTPYAQHHNDEILAALEAITGEEAPRPSEPPAATTTRYWKVAPGEKGSEWERCRDLGVIGIGWAGLGDLSATDEKEFQRRASAARAEHGWGAGVDQAWKFRNILVGDRIVANAGTTRVLGIGTVVGPYVYVADDPLAHRLPVRWDDVVERAVDMGGWRKTLIRLTGGAFDAIVSAPAVDALEVDPLEPVALPPGGIDFEGVLTHLENKSLAFPAELVASYLLALQARRFVLLTGISGTGKTQLAIEVARLLSPQAEAAPVSRASDGVDVVVRAYMVRHGRIVVPASLARGFAALFDETTKRLDLELPGGLRGSAALYKDPERPGLLYVLPSGAQRKWFISELEPGQVLRLRRQTDAQEVERLVIDRKAEAPVCMDPSDLSYELMAVRPDWTDARALLGFYNPLTKSYLTAPTLQLVLRAQDEAARATTEARAPRPFFLIFDEMNLARVEHYFSDFLSAMESGEEIHLHDDEALADEGVVPTRVRLPPNLFVVGTVNVDETTYMFSPKVLDRAFVLEFNDVDLDALSAPVLAEEPASTPLALTRMGSGLQLLGRPADDEWQRFEQHAGGDCRERLGKLHATLVEEHRHFGYRVAREIARFVDLAAQQTEGTPEALLAALDVAVLAKVLPKLHGTQAELEETLARLFAWAVDHPHDADDVRQLERWRIEARTLVNVGGKSPSLPRTAAKLFRMRRRLRAHGFVSFIE